MLDKAAKAETAEELRRVRKLAEGLAVGRYRPKQRTGKQITVRQLGERWTSGELHRQYPDQVRAKRTVDDDISRLEKHIYPVIGELPVAAVTLERTRLVYWHDATEAAMDRVCLPSL